MKVLCVISRGRHIDGSKENLCHEMGEILQTFEKEPDHKFSDAERKTFLITEIELSQEQLNKLHGAVIPMPAGARPLIVPGVKTLLDLKDVPEKVMEEISLHKELAAIDKEIVSTCCSAVAAKAGV